MQSSAITGSTGSSWVIGQMNSLTDLSKDSSIDALKRLHCSVSPPGESLVRFTCSYALEILVITGSTGRSLAIVS